MIGCIALKDYMQTGDSPLAQVCGVLIKLNIKQVNIDELKGWDSAFLRQFTAINLNKMHAFTLKDSIIVLLKTIQ